MHQNHIISIIRLWYEIKETSLKTTRELQTNCRESLDTENGAQ